MATGDASSPSRFLQGQHGSDTRHLALDVFGGEVYAAFDLATLTLDKHTIRSVSGGERSARFPKVWKASSEYHTPGVELLGTEIETTEVTISIDDILVSHTALSDLDKMLTHFEIRSEYSAAMGMELAKVFDKNVFRQTILAARASADGPFPGGNVITDATLTNSGNIDGRAWVDAILTMNEAFFNKDVPETMVRYMSVNKAVWNAIKWAKDANGNYLALHRDFGIQGGGVSGNSEYLEIDNVRVYKSRNMPTADETAVSSVYSKYRADYSTTTGVFWCPMAVGTTKMRGIGFESTRDVRRLEDFMVASMLVGHGILRPECAGEFKTS